MGAATSLKSTQFTEGGSAKDALAAATAGADVIEAGHRPNADDEGGGYEVDLDAELETSISMGTFDARGAAATAAAAAAAAEHNQEYSWSGPVAAALGDAAAALAEHDRVMAGSDSGSVSARSKSRGDVLSREITGDEVDLGTDDDGARDQTFTTVASAGTSRPLGHQGDFGATPTTLAAFNGATPSPGLGFGGGHDGGGDDGDVNGFGGLGVGEAAGVGVGGGFSTGVTAAGGVAEDSRLGDELLLDLSQVVRGGWSACPPLPPWLSL